MSDLPFGFGPSDPDESRSGGQGPGGPGGPAGFGFGMPGMGGPGGGGEFDMSQLGQMLTQLGQMLSQSSAGGGGPVNYQLAQQMAVQQLGGAGTTSPTAEQRTAAQESVRLAELWLEDATTLPSGVSTVAVWSPKEWIEATMPTWQRLCDPVAQRVAGAWVEGLPSEAREMAGPMIGMISQVGGMAFGSQLGSGLGQLAAEVLTSTDVGLPLGPDGTAALLPASVARFTEGPSLDGQGTFKYEKARPMADEPTLAPPKPMAGAQAEEMMNAPGLLGRVKQAITGD